MRNIMAKYYQISQNAYQTGNSSIVIVECEFYYLQ